MGLPYFHVIDDNVVFLAVAVSKGEGTYVPGSAVIRIGSFRSQAS